MRRGRSWTAAESIFGLHVNQSLSQPIKCIPLMVHKAPELTKLQAASYVKIRLTRPLELYTKPSYHGEVVYFVVVERLCDVTVALFERLDWKTPCLMHTLVNQLWSLHKDIRAFYASIDDLSLCAIKSLRSFVLKSAWRGHTRYLYKSSQNRHNNYCTVVLWG